MMKMTTSSASLAVVLLVALVALASAQTTISFPPPVFGNAERYHACIYDSANAVSYTSLVLFRQTADAYTYSVTEQILKRVGDCSSRHGVYSVDNLGYRFKVLTGSGNQVSSNTFRTEIYPYVHTRTVYSDDDALAMRNLCQTRCCRFHGKGRPSDVRQCDFAACGNSTVQYGYIQWSDYETFKVPVPACNSSSVAIPDVNAHTYLSTSRERERERESHLPLT